MDLRSYAKAKEVYDQEVKKPISERTNMNHPLVDQVSAMTFEIAKEKIKAMQEEDDSV